MKRTKYHFLLSPKEAETLDKAVEIKKTSRSQFARDAALSEAERVIRKKKRKEK